MLRSLDGEAVSLAKFPRPLEVLKVRKGLSTSKFHVFFLMAQNLLILLSELHLAKIKGQKVVKHPCHKMRSHLKVALIGVVWRPLGQKRSTSSGGSQGFATMEKAHIQRHGDVGVSLNGGFSSQIIHF